MHRLSGTICGATDPGSSAQSAGEEKVLALTPGERVRLLNELAEPFGFAYLPSEDIFTSRLDAWQRDKGYEAKYDTMAVGAGMVIDAFPVYFNYEGRTWLVEFWKGQYGINTAERSEFTMRRA